MRIPYHQFVADQLYHKRGRFRYDRGSYESKKIKIECMEHGWFEQSTSNHHSRQAGCPTCAKVATGNRCRGSQAKWAADIAALNLGDNYEILEVPDLLSGQVKMRCREHNESYAIPLRSLLYSGVIGCKSCQGVTPAYDTIADMFLVSKGRFKISSPARNLALPNRIEGWCPKHGRFSAEKSNVVKPGGWGCPKCGKEHAGRLNSWNQGITKEQAIEDLFYYVRGRYQILKATGLKGDVEFKLLCPVHGAFRITWKGYIKGGRCLFGCPVCSEILRVRNMNKSSIANRRQNYLSTAALLNPQLQVVGEFVGVMNNITVRCSKGHITSVPATRLLEGRSKARCEICFGVTGSSQPEEEISKLLDCFDVAYIRRDRKILGGKELDFYLPGHKIAIEFNGAIWHSEKYQADPLSASKKRLACEKLGIRLLNICSSIHQKVYLGVIANALGLDLETYMARKCEVVFPCNKDAEVAELFRNKHVQGFPPGCQIVGLRHKEHLVAAMAFSLVNSERGKLKDESRWELRRFASFGKVQGGASRLLTAFLRSKPQCREVISYSDNSLFTGKVYEVLGFKLLHEAPPSYGYTRNGQHVYHKAGFRRELLATKQGFAFNPDESERENCLRNKWHRVWDCGKKKWSLKC